MPSTLPRPTVAGVNKSVSTPELRIVCALYSSSPLALTWPLVEMIATQEKIEFRARFGLGRFLGPWSIGRTSVHSVGIGMRALRQGVEIVGDDQRRWIIGSLAEKEQVLHDLAALGYPVRSTF